MKKLITLLLILSFTIKAQEIKIGTQTWTTKNLDVSKFRNGDAIPLAKTNAEWALAGQNKQPAWCYYENKGENGTKYGKLYNWFAVMDARGLAPSGYHVPTDAEWTILTDYLGGDSIAGAKMKSTSGWNSFDGTKPCNVCKDWTDGYREGKEACKACANWTEDYRGGNTCKLCKDTKIVNAAKHNCLSCKNSKTLSAKISGNGSNTSGFTGLPGGFRSNDGPFGLIGGAFVFWSASQDEARLSGDALSAHIADSIAAVQSEATETATTPKNATEITTKAEAANTDTFLYAWCLAFVQKGGKAGREGLNKPFGLSIRCVKD